MTSGTAGASMEEAKGLLSISILYPMGEAWRFTCVKKVMDAMTATLAHFSFSDQFMGFWGSSGPSQSTIFGSASVFIVSGSFLSESSLRWPASRSISFSKLEPAGDAFPFGTGNAEIGTFSGSVLLAASGAESNAFFGSVDGAASGTKSGAVSGTDAGITSGFVDIGALDAVPGTISRFVDEIASGADRYAFVAEPDAAPGAIRVSFSSGPGVRAFSKLGNPTPPSAAGTVLPVVIRSSEGDDEAFSGTHWDIVEGARPAGEGLFIADRPAC